MTWTHCEVYWDLDFEPCETSGGQPVALVASVFVFDGLFLFFLTFAFLTRDL